MTAGTGGSRRAWLPLVAAAVLVALVFLLPRRGASGAAGGAPDRPLLPLDEPPAWAVQHGGDEVTRCLDRLDWGGHDSLLASQRVLQAHRGQLGPEILSRLRAVTDDNPVLVAKLVELLGGEGSADGTVVDELLRRALSPRALVAKAALRVLAGVADPRALDGIVPRLLDGDPDVRSMARGALADRARRGDDAAQAIILAELRISPSEPDLAYLTVLQDFPDTDEARGLLRSVAEAARGGARLVALAALLRLDDPDARAAFEELLATRDLELRVEVLRAIAASGRVAGEALWDDIARNDVYPEMMALVKVLTLAYDRGEPSAPHATAVMESIAANPLCSARVDVVSQLYDRRHPWAVELTRAEVAGLVGNALGQSTDRVILGPDDQKPAFADLALERLRDESLRPGDRGVLCRMLAHIAPGRSADLVVRYALQRDGATPELASAMRPMLPLLGTAGLERLAQEIGTPSGNELFMEAAGALGSGAALPDLQRLVLDPATSAEQRRQGLDTLARLHDGPREATLRAILQALDDPALEQRGRLLFWNYM